MVSLNRRNVVGGAAALGLLGSGKAGAFWKPAPSPGAWTERRSMPFGVQEIYPTWFRRSVPDSVDPFGPAVLVNAGGRAYAVSSSLLN